MPKRTDQEALLRLLLEKGRDHAVILLDKNGMVVAWLMGATRMFGYTDEEMLGQSFERLFLPDDCAKGVPRSELEIGAKYGRQEDDRWLVRKDGVRLWVSGVLTCLHDQAGKVSGYSKILRDRTDLKEQLDLLRDQLKILEMENQQMTVMLGTLAHELRNPLGVLSNATHLINATHSDDKKLKPVTQLIDRQVSYLSTLIQDLLENVRLQTGKVALHTEPTDLKMLLNSALESAVLVPEKRQKIELLLPQSPIVLEADPVRLKQVFVNLLSNAAKFSGDGGTIWIRAITEDDEAVVRVQDQGQGIPTDLLPRLFELFSQGKDMTDQEGQLGLGLGLAIVKQYVELHGGSVQARSEGAGRGSVFIVRLPLVQKKPD